MKKIVLFFLLFVFAQLVLTGCSSTKSREDQGPVAKLWHNMNSEYNGYFNANEIMEQSLLALDEQYEDNYTRRLPMFPFLEVDNLGEVAPELDRAIEKVAIVVKKHPYSNWVDDSYLLVGQAQLVKQDYESAERTLGFTVNEFRPRPERKRTKSRKKKGKGANAGAGEDAEEDEFVSQRDVATQKPSAKDRLRARKIAQKERQRLNKERQKETKRRQKEREKARKARIKARKKGIRLPPVKRDTTSGGGLENEPEAIAEEEGEQEMEEGPIGMISIFSNTDLKRDGTKQYGKKSGSYALKHRPAHQEARLWYAWALIKRDNFERAQLILEDLRADRGTFPDVRRKAMAVQAFYYLEQERLEEALPFLEEAAEVARERNEAARYRFIAGQLYQELGQPSQASDAFRKVIAAKPAYEFEIGARIALAQNDYLSGSGGPETALANLEKMAREEKNRFYESQIFFAAAMIAINSGDQETGTDYLRRAVSSPYAGANQQLEAYQMLGDRSYESEDYPAAKLYYDSTLQVMQAKDSRFTQTSLRRDNLTGVYDYTNEVILKDSLLRIGLMPEAERNNLAEQIFEARRAANSAANYSTPAVRGSSTPLNNPVASNINNSDFWAYDNQALRRGQRNFEREWGDRPLTDDWRRSRRTNQNLFEDEADGTTALNDEPELITDDEIGSILKDVPTTPEAQESVRRQMSDAYFKLGRDYRDLVGNNRKAIEAFTTLDERFPGSGSEAESWYYLYLLHTEEGNAAKAQEYVKKLQGKYRNSKFERLASDPNYGKKLLSEEARDAKTYEEALAAFENGDYQKARQMATQARSKLLGQHPLKPRYALLLAMAEGKLSGREAYIAGLRNVVSRFQTTPEATRAKEILRLLGEGGARLPGRANAGATGFKESMDQLHYVMVLFKDPEVNMNQIKVIAADYNAKYHKLDRLRVTPIYLGTDSKTPVLVLRRFKTGEEAMKYLAGADENNSEFLDYGKYEYDIYAVSQTNYREILKARSAEGYGEWFRANY